MRELLLRRKTKLLLGRVDEGCKNEQYVATMMKNIESFGYIFSKEVFKKLSSYPMDELNKIYLEIVPVLKKMVGANVIYRPLYPNFPNSVMEMDECKLYLQAFIHYISNGEFKDFEEKKERLPLFENPELKIIDIGCEDDIDDIFNNICNSKTSLSNTDKDDLEKIFSKRFMDIPSEIPLKENVALITSIYLKNAPLIKVSDVKHLFKTSTDVLRLITAMSDGDISLASNCKFRSFKRKERRFIMDLLENCNNIEEDMLRYRKRWIRIGERIHPLEFSAIRYPKTILAFNHIRNKPELRTFSSKVDQAIKEKDDKTVLELLKSRPGELARKLDYLLRVLDNNSLIINTFKNVANKVSTPVLLQVKEHFSHRADSLKSRVFFPKGNISKCYYMENKLAEIPEAYCKAIVTICELALIEIYKEKEFLGKVYLSEEFKKFIVPFSQRSASKAMKMITRGSKFQIPDNTKFLRSFIWWTNTPNDDRVDLDLSAAIYDEDFNFISDIWYRNLKSMNCYHSGDITNGGPTNGIGASEFIDIDIDHLVSENARYVIFQVYNFTNHKFSDLPNVKFGWMNRESINSGEIYEPKTVEQCMDLSSPTATSIPVIFDIVNREFIWCDIGLTNHKEFNNVKNNLNDITAIAYNIVHMYKPNLYDLINLHIKARGIQVDNKEEADIIFDINEGITPFDIDIFMGEYL